MAAQWLINCRAQKHRRLCVCVFITDSAIIHRDVCMSVECINMLHVCRKKRFASVTRSVPGAIQIAAQHARRRSQHWSAREASIVRPVELPAPCVHDNRNSIICSFIRLIAQPFPCALCALSPSHWSSMMPISSFSSTGPLCFNWQLAISFTFPLSSVCQSLNWQNGNWLPIGPCSRWINKRAHLLWAYCGKWAASAISRCANCSIDGRQLGR